MEIPLAFFLELDTFAS